MKCPKCEEEGKRSRVYDKGGTSTLMYCTPYYDEEGVYHNHDSNTITHYYECSEGHKFRTKGTGTCPNCDFGKDSLKIEIL